MNNDDKYYANVFGVTPMTIGRWRRGVVKPPYSATELAAYLKRDNALAEIPAWLVAHAKD